MNQELINSLNKQCMQQENVEDEGFPAEYDENIEEMVAIANAVEAEYHRKQAERVQHLRHLYGTGQPGEVDRRRNPRYYVVSNTLQMAFRRIGDDDRLQDELDDFAHYYDNLP
ncbi:hypothetical protein MBANPS3_012183 [Mucor bainieri]